MTLEEGNTLGTEQQDSTESSTATETEYAPFFDASKVPAELQPSFKEMQGAWTKKMQGLGDINSAIEAFGGIEEAAPFINQFTTPEGTLAWFKHIASQIGPEAAVELLGYEVKGEEDHYQDSEDDDDESFDAPMTRAEFLEWQQSQETQRQEEIEDKQLNELFSSMGITDDNERYFIANAALKHPVHFGLEKRLQLGKQEHEAYLTGKLDSRVAQQREAAQDGVGSLSGGTPSSDTSSMPKTFAEARVAAMQHLANMNN